MSSLRSVRSKRSAPVPEQENGKSARLRTDNDRPSGPDPLEPQPSDSGLRDGSSDDDSDATTLAALRTAEKAYKQGQTELKILKRTLAVMHPSGSPLPDTTPPPSSSSPYDMPEMDSLTELVAMEAKFPRFENMLRSSSERAVLPSAITPEALRTGLYGVDLHAPYLGFESAPVLVSRDASRSGNALEQLGGRCPDYSPGEIIARSGASDTIYDFQRLGRPTTTKHSQRITLGQYVKEFEEGKAVSSLLGWNAQGVCKLEFEAPEICRRMDVFRKHGVRLTTSGNMLLSPAGAFTDWHVDTTGIPGWAYLAKGKKVWYFAQPTPENIACLSNKSKDGWVPEPDSCTHVIQSAGQVLFIPGGVLHSVYTSEESIMFGGDFMTSYGLETQFVIWDYEETWSFGSNSRAEPFLLTCLLEIKSWSAELKCLATKPSYAPTIIAALPPLEDLKLLCSFTAKAAQVIQDRPLKQGGKAAGLQHAFGRECRTVVDITKQCLALEELLIRVKRILARADAYQASLPETRTQE